MFLIKIFHFLKGYVILSIRGNNKEEFLSRLVKGGVKILESITFDDEIRIKIFARDFFQFRDFKPKCRVHILKKCGLWFWIKRTRKTFLYGMIIFLVLLTLSSQFIWDIRYVGVENTDMEKLEEATRKAGLKQGMLKANIKSGYEMKDIILNNTDNIAWAWVYVKGTVAVVKIRENIIPPEVFDPDVPCDIVASRSGLIKSITTIRGKCIATENQMVAPGDTIISGTYEFEDKTGYQVHASGIVKAQTEHIRSGVYKQVYCYKKYTGRKRHKVRIRLFGLDIPLYIKDDISFELCDTTEKDYDLKIAGNYLGIGISVKTAKEYIEEKEPISFESTVDFAQKELEKEISKELLFGAELIDKKTETEKIDNETVKVTVIMNFIEEIGTEKRIDEVTQVEPKTDRIATGD
ncbi:MAG: sporulation protein YqfD [Clostridia bacterium]|nr:sporulation protein YqfD [Clostridia bacterium]